MKKFEIWYYKYNNYITTKIVEAKDIKSAIKKARVKNIEEIHEI